MRQRESWRKVRRDNAIRAEKKVESFSSTIKSGLIDFQCRREREKGREGGKERSRVALRGDAKSDVTERKRKKTKKKRRKNYCVSQNCWRLSALIALK